MAPLSASLPRSAKSRSFAAGLIIAAILISFGIWQGLQIRSGVDKAEDAAMTLEALTQGQGDLLTFFRDLPSLHGTLSQADEQLKEARSKLRIALPFIPLFGWVPSIGDRAQEGKEMLSLGEDLIKGSLNLLTTLEKVINLSEGPLLLEGGRFNTGPLQALSDNTAQLEGAIDLLENAQATQRTLLSTDPLENIRRLLDFSQQALPELKGLAEMSMVVAHSWRSFMGFEGPRAYLLAAQNSDELRASGGYLPGAWLLELEQGHIRRLKFWDTTAVDNLEAGLPTPPGGIVQSLWGGVWLFRDAGWYPDFPTSAQVMENLFRLGTGNTFDGVVAVNQWAANEIVSAIAPINLLDNQILTGDSYLGVLEEGKDREGRIFMDTLLEGMLDGLEQEGSSEKFGALMLALKRSLDEKHLLPFFKDEALQRQIAKNGWGGEVKDYPGDYLMIVDSNVGWNKADRLMERKVTYHVDLSDEKSPKARIDIVYYNRGLPIQEAPCGIQSPSASGDTYEARKNSCYWDYLRVYTPKESQLKGSSSLTMPEGAIYRRLGYNDIEETVQSFVESDKKVFTGFFAVPPGQSKEVTFLYDLPQNVLTLVSGELRYSLLIQKQPGIKKVPVEISIILPENYEVKRSNNDFEKLSNGEMVLHTSLRTDIEFVLTLHKSG